MTLLAPGWLALLAVVGALAVAYLVQQRRRPRYAVRFTNLELLASVAPRRPGWRRHVPAALLLLALAGAVVALARPSRMAQVPRERATIIMAVDVSISMDASDVTPNRLEAARQAALAFVDRLPPRLNLGLVAFAGQADLLVSPTADREAVRAALRSLRLAEATAIGEAVVKSLDAIQRVPGEPGQEPPPAHVVLLSDGETTVGVPNEIAARQASRAGVPVSTIAFGTPWGSILYQGETVAVPTNPEALRELAQQTGGSFFEALDSDELERVYGDIGTSIGYSREPREVTAWFVGAAFALAAAAAATSLLWSPRLP